MAERKNKTTQGNYLNEYEREISCLHEQNQSSQIDENLNCHNKGDNGNSYRDFIGGQNDWEKCWH